MRITARKQGGFSLVELMVGITVGLFVVIAASAVYLNTFASSSVSTHLVKLNQNMRSIMDIIVFDIHRAGAWGGAAAGGGGNLFTRRVGDGRTETVISDLYVSTDNKCILYSFDVNQDGAVDTSATATSEFFGFRYNSNTQRIEVLDQTVGTPVTNTSSSIANCNAHSWQAVNLPNEVVVTALTFSTVGSQCLAFNPATFTPGNTATFVQWQLTATNSSVAACDTTISSGSTVPLAATGAYSSLSGGAVTIASTITGRAEIRQIVVTLTAQHARDATLTRTLTETIRVRNDRVI